jgi:hypothetical protein
MDKNNLQPGDETLQPSDADEKPDSAIERMTTDGPVDPDRPDDPGITTD